MGLVFVSANGGDMGSESVMPMLGLLATSDAEAEAGTGGGDGRIGVRNPGGVIALL